VYDAYDTFISPQRYRVLLSLHFENSKLPPIYRTITIKL